MLREVSGAEVIDISPTACRVMAKRLRDVCNMKESEPRWKAHQPDAFVVRDLPWTVEKLRALPHFEFENWAVIALGGIPNKVQVGDMGIDGRIFPVGTARLSARRSPNPPKADCSAMIGSPSRSNKWTRLAAPTSTLSKPSWSEKAKAADSAVSSSASATPKTPNTNAPHSTSERVESSSC
jgi:hypothetical protein